MLDNPRSPRVRAVAKLAKRSARSETGLFLLEGPQAVAEALTFRPELVVDLFATPTALERYPEIAQRPSRPASRSSSSPSTCWMRWPTPSRRRASSRCARQFPTSIRDIFTGEPKLVAILEEVRDPGNAGTIIRAADSAGADAVVLTGRTVDLYNPKVVRSTTGSLFHVPVAVGADLDDVIGRAHAAGLQVLAADIKGEDLLAARRDGELARPTAWVFGNEARGPRRRPARAGGPRRHGADLRPRRVDEPRDSGLRLPLRIGVRPALLTPFVHSLHGCPQIRSGPGGSARAG